MFLISSCLCCLAVIAGNCSKRREGTSVLFEFSGWIVLVYASVTSLRDTAYTTLLYLSIHLRYRSSHFISDFTFLWASFYFILFIFFISLFYLRENEKWIFLQWSDQVRKNRIKFCRSVLLRRWWLRRCNLNLCI